MNDIGVHITGLSELEKTLDQLPDRIERNFLTGGVRAGANVFRNEARARATVGSSTIMRLLVAALLTSKEGGVGHIRDFKGQKIATLPGFMRSKIAVWKRRDPHHSVTFSIGVSGYKDRFTKFFAFYWRFLEFGTSKMAAKPFLRPAFEAKTGQAIEATRIYLANRIEREGVKNG